MINIAANALGLLFLLFIVYVLYLGIANLILGRYIEINCNRYKGLKIRKKDIKSVTLSSFGTYGGMVTIDTEENKYEIVYRFDKSKAKYMFDLIDKVMRNGFLSVVTDYKKSDED